MKANIDDHILDLNLYGIKFVFKPGKTRNKQLFKIDMQMKAGQRINSEDQLVIQDYLVDNVLGDIRKSNKAPKKNKQPEPPQPDFPEPDPPQPDPPKPKKNTGPRKPREPKKNTKNNFSPDDKKVEMYNYDYISTASGRNRIKKGVQFEKYAKENDYDKNEILKKGITKCKICGLKYFEFFGPQHYMGNYHMSK